MTGVDGNDGADQLRALDRYRGRNRSTQGMAENDDRSAPDLIQKSGYIGGERRDLVPVVRGARPAVPPQVDGYQPMRSLEMRQLPGPVVRVTREPVHERQRSPRTLVREEQ